MTNEQCIEIAEKVWGWEKETEPRLQGTWRPPGAGHVLDKREIKLIVNSWQGFGRTVEAMEKKEIQMHPSPGSTLEFSRFAIDPVQIKWNGLSDDAVGLIEATHLAALEALK